MINKIESLPIIHKENSHRISRAIVAPAQLYSILMSAIVDDDRGIPPNWLGSMCFSIAGPTNFSITNSSAIFARQQVSEIGLRCLLISSTTFSFGTGITFANFYKLGKDW